MQEFKVNDFVTLKLEGKDTVIYVAGERFRQCKYLLLNIPVEEVSSFDEIDSIDEVAEKLDNSLESMANPLKDYYRFDISPEVGFWAHCSNLQVWSENDYNTRLLHSNLAFPLLQKLTEVGDKQALKVFKEEIAKRIESGYEPVIKFLWNERFIRYLSKEELSAIPHFKEFMHLLDIEARFNVKFFWADDRLDADEENVWFSMSEGYVNELVISGIPEFHSFPKSLTNLRHLTDIRMIENNIKSIPDTIANLDLLTYLDLTGNRITKIPEMIGNCKKLEVLKLRANLISTFPDSIGNLTLLKELDLANNCLTILTNSIGKLNKLKRIDLGSNRLETLPNSILKLQSLEFLRLVGNKITLTSKYLGKLKSEEKKTLIK